MFKLIFSKPAILTYFVCILSTMDAPEAQSVLVRSTHTHTHTHTLQPGEQHLSCGLCFQCLFIKHVPQFSNSKDGILQQSPIELILTLSLGFICKIMCIYNNNKCMCVFLISPVPIAEPLTSELIDTPVFHNLAPRPIKYRVSVPIPSGYYNIIVLLLLQNLQQILFYFV